MIINAFVTIKVSIIIDRIITIIIVKIIIKYESLYNKNNENKY